MCRANLDRFVAAGWHLYVRKERVAAHVGSVRASVDLGSIATSHNVIARGIEDALKQLDSYLERYDEASWSRHPNRTPPA